MAVISYKSWQTRFGGASDIIGKTIKLSLRPFTIVRVAAQGRIHSSWQGLKPGVTVTQAKSNLDTMTAKLAEEWPAINEGMKLWWSLVGLASYFGAV